LFEKLKSHISLFIEKILKKDKNIDEFLEEFKLNLIESDVAYPVAEQICSTIKNELDKIEKSSDKLLAAKTLVKKTIEDILSIGGKIDLINIIEQKRAIREPAILLFMGVNGTGKTTTIAKTAYFLIKKGYTVVLACSDTFRAGSIEQLEEHAKRVGVKVIKHRYGGDPAAAAFDTVNYARSKGINVVLIDTAGRMQTNQNLLEEMKKIARVTQPDLKILVVDALTANDAVEQSKVFNEVVGVDAVVLTKLDADARGGAALSVAYTIKKPILFLGVGQKYEDLTLFNSSFILDKLIG
jgi:fused signal recognition particle receptor